MAAASKVEQKCNFCATGVKDVFMLVTAPGGNPAICDQCIMLAQRLVVQRRVGAGYRPKLVASRG